MHDIKIPDQHGSKKGDFAVSHLSERGNIERSGFGAEPAETKAPEPGEKVKVKFEKFVQLVATHDFEEVMKRHAEEDVILSTNLLTDLANAHEEAPNEGKKLPIVLIVGVIIGVVITYLVIRF